MVGLIFLWLCVGALAFWMAVMAVKLHGLVLRYGTVLTYLEALRQGEISDVDLADVGFESRSMEWPGMN